MTRKIIQLPTQAELRTLLAYDPDTGRFTWRVSRGTVRAGSPAGWLHKLGYVYIGLNGKNYKAHRLAWVYTYGTDPVGLIDHIDRNPANNGLANLRAVSDGQNNQNKRVYKNSASGHKGVGWYARRNLWRVRIQHENKVVLVGFFATVAHAVEARKAAEKQLHTHASKT
jgi:hypothetical protein